ncbi:MAG: hydroxymethylglutaryl-CoA synthase [Deltaproteobacteria bacterium]|nr:hydroxymethylglutaryl-CoA synthase [Deltaproteobacteria bacterium]MBI3388488.1 hydroxymethylglutaryl-CoA synthase [Deltaproteobacteria bacterium]
MMALVGPVGPVGIDQLGVYVPEYVLPLDQLAAARGVPVEKLHIGIGAQQMAVAPPWEDAVTLGANAAARAIAQGHISPDEIGLLLVATETGVDHAKPASIFLHELLGVTANCRTLELKHACYSGTAGVMIAADWIRSGAARGRKALVVATDIARYDLHSSAEFTQGAGAVAVVVSEQPRLLALDPISGVFASNVYDFWRPLDRREALVDGKFSVDCYLNALDGAVADYRNGHSTPSGALSEEFAALLYHTPFPKMAYKAHLRLIEGEWRAAGRNPADLGPAAEQSYRTLVEPTLGAARVVGNTYTASLYLCLAWLAEQQGRALEGRSLGLFSYGSGCCAEFFSGQCVAGSAKVAAGIGVADLLAARRTLTVDEYEAFGRDGAGADLPVESRANFCRFAGVREDKRLYERTGSLAQ